MLIKMRKIRKISSQNNIIYNNFFKKKTNKLLSFKKKLTEFLVKPIRSMIL
jgi:hypothetical protein